MWLPQGRGKWTEGTSSAKARDQQAGQVAGDPAQDTVRETASGSAAKPQAHSETPEGTATMMCAQR